MYVCMHIYIYIYIYTYNHTNSWLRSADFGSARDASVTRTMTLEFEEPLLRIRVGMRV